MIVRDIGVCNIDDNERSALRSGTVAMFLLPSAGFVSKRVSELLDLAIEPLASSGEPAF